jgi:hypothetical protein
LADNFALFLDLRIVEQARLSKISMLKQGSKQKMVGCFPENQAKQVLILSKVCLLKQAMFATN